MDKTTGSHRSVLGIWALALVVRLVLLFFLHDTYYVSGMAQGDLAYGIVTGQGLVHNALPGCGIGVVQDHYRKLIDVENYLKHYKIWCAELGLEHVRNHPEPFIAYMMSGPGILLAGTYYIFGEHRYIYLQVIRLVLDSLGIFMLFWIGRRYFSDRIGLVAALLYAVFIPAIRITLAGGIRDAWMPLLLLTALYCFLRALNQVERRLGWFGLAGLAIAVGCYFRPTVLLLPFFWTPLLLWKRRLPLTGVARAVGVMLMPVVLLLLPWWVRNYRVFNRCIPTNSGLAMAIWQAFGEFDTPTQGFWRFGNPFGAVCDDRTTYQQYLDAGGTASYLSPEFADDYFRPKVIHAVTSEPLWVLSLLVRRLVEVGVGGSGLRFDDNIIPWRIQRAFLSGGTILLWVLAAIGLYLNRHNLYDSLTILSVTIPNILVHLLISVKGRYLFPGYAALLVFVAFSLVHLIESLARKSCAE